MAVWKRYRALCVPFETGCRQCGTEIAESRAYCSDVCRKAFERQHFWNTASSHALTLACPGGESHVRDERGLWKRQQSVCRRCQKSCGLFLRHVNGQREAEVNHIVPVNGNRPHFGCCHHQENLEVLCHDCHVTVTKEQRRAGLIGPPLKAQVPLDDGGAAQQEMCR